MRAVSLDATIIKIGHKKIARLKLTCPLVGIAETEEKALIRLQSKVEDIFKESEIRRVGHRFFIDLDPTDIVNFMLTFNNTERKGTVMRITETIKVRNVGNVVQSATITVDLTENKVLSCDVEDIAQVLVLNIYGKWEWQDYSQALLISHARTTQANKQTSIR